MAEAGRGVGVVDPVNDLLISGSTTTAVATAELLAAADSLTALAREAALIGGELARINNRLPAISLGVRGAPAAAAIAENHLGQSIVVMGQLEVAARALAVALRGAADTYQVGESLIGGWLSGLGSGSVASTPGGTVAASLGDPGALGGAPVTDPRQWLMSPEGVAAVRRAVSGADEAMLTAIGIPMPAARLLGDEGAGVVSLATVAALVGGVGATVGLVRESPVAVVARRELPAASAPSGFAERLDRIPDPDRDGGQIRVDVYERPDGSRYAEVAVAGTQEFNPLATDEPFDMSSNLANTIGGSSGSVRAVREALELAGVDASTPIVITAHSQGGALAARLAESGDYTVAGLVTFGAPTGQIPIPEHTPSVLVEHLDDPVPAFGGAQDNTHAVRVERRAFLPGELPFDSLMPTHDLTSYRVTALAMDADDSPDLARVASRLDSLAVGAQPVSSTIYDAERLTTVPPRAVGSSERDSAAASEGLSAPLSATTSLRR